MPELYQSFVSSRLLPSGLKLMIATEYDFFICLGNEMVHHSICQYYPFLSTVEDLGCIMARWKRYYRSHLDCYPLVIQR
jgi:hypothetical protein